MCFHSSRFAARKDENGEIVLYYDQDEKLWNQELITKGIYFLHKASQGSSISKYHLEAGIAYWQDWQKRRYKRKNGRTFLQLYNRLLQIEYSPVAALNRTYALSKTNGKLQAITEAEKLQLTNNHYYYTLLGELYEGIDNIQSKQNFETAYTLAKTQTDKQVIKKKIDRLAQSERLSQS